tara:strand:- start:343 stop:480 length:138 start_codon:yes stop_codon:yes gene_type:complete
VVQQEEVLEDAVELKRLQVEPRAAHAARLEQMEEQLAPVLRVRGA